MGPGNEASGQDGVCSTPRNVLKNGCSEIDSGELLHISIFTQVTGIHADSFYDLGGGGGLALRLLCQGIHRETVPHPHQEHIHCHGVGVARVRVGPVGMGG